MPAKFRAPELVLPIGLIASLLVILAPLPSAVIDVLLAINIAAAVLILLTTIFVETPVEFSVFPTVLLSATLGRLVLNVATTRMILTHANTAGLSAAGGIVEGFGSFVAGDKVVVGIIVFVIIVLIQFLVVTKGATRISEVAARFALDGMPGRQMAIDADVAAGSITKAAAQLQRAELQRGANFYGAMDGASKFVRGDAIAGLAITMINIVGGLFLGIVQGGMSFGQATELYTKLTIGDGLVSQIPAFLIALAAGVLITRSSEPTNLPVEFLRQLTSRPEPLVVAATFLGLLVFTRLPAMPLLLVGGAFAGIAYWMTSSPDWLEGNRLAEEPTPAVKPAAAESRVEDLLTVNPVELEIGVGLLRLADPARGGDLLDRITGLRKKVAIELGLVMPRVRIRDNLRLDEYEYRLKIFENPVAEGQAYALRILAFDKGDAQGTVDGVPAEHPAQGCPAWWIDPAHRASANRKGFALLTAADVVIEHLEHTVLLYADELLTRDATKKLLDQHRQHAPTIIDELLHEKLDLGQIQQVLQRLLREQVPIRNLAGILEALSDGASTTNELEPLTEFVRQRMARTLSTAFSDDAGKMVVVTLSSEWNARLQSAAAHADGLGSPLTTAQTRELIEEIRLGMDAIPAGLPRILLVSAELRPFVRELTRRELPAVHVLSFREVTEASDVRSAGVAGEVGAAA